VIYACKSGVKQHSFTNLKKWGVIWPHDPLDPVLLRCMWSRAIKKKQSYAAVTVLWRRLATASCSSSLLLLTVSWSVAVAVIRGDVIDAKIPRPRPQPSRPKTKAFKYTARAEIKIRRTSDSLYNKLSYRKQIARRLRSYTVRGRHTTWPWNLGYGSFEVIENSTIWKLGYTASCSHSIATGRRLSLAILDIFSVRYWHDLEIWGMSHSRTSQMAPFDRCEFLLAFPSNYGAIGLTTWLKIAKFLYPTCI